MRTKAIAEKERREKAEKEKPVEKPSEKPEPKVEKAVEKAVEIVKPEPKPEVRVEPVYTEPKKPGKVKKSVKKFAEKFIKTEYGRAIVKKAKAGVIKLTSDDLKADVMTRNKARDIFDAGFLIAKKIPANIELANRKLEYYDMKFEKGAFIESLMSKK